MKKIDTVLFDLDGTLTDPGEGITNSARYALKKFGISVSDRSRLYSFIGPPLIDSFMEYYGFTQEKAQTAVKYYREYYAEKGIFENLLYDGITPLLQSLSEAGKKIVLATSKPEPFAKQILAHFDILRYFDFVAGALLNETRTNKDEVIAHALSSCGIPAENAIMVGDRKYDITGAAKNGLFSIGVLYGYGSREELEDAGANKIAENVSELKDFLLNQKG